MRQIQTNHRMSIGKAEHVFVIPYKLDGRWGFEIQSIAGGTQMMIWSSTADYTTSANANKAGKKIISNCKKKYGPRKTPSGHTSPRLGR